MIRFSSDPTIAAQEILDELRDHELDRADGKALLRDGNGILIRGLSHLAITYYRKADALPDVVVTKLRHLVERVRPDPDRDQLILRNPDVGITCNLPNGINDTPNVYGEIRLRLTQIAGGAAAMREHALQGILRCLRAWDAFAKLSQSQSVPDDLQTLLAELHDIRTCMLPSDLSADWLAACEVIGKAVHCLRMVVAKVTNGEDWKPSFWPALRLQILKLPTIDFQRTAVDIRREFAGDKQADNESPPDQNEPPKAARTLLTGWPDILSALEVKKAQLETVKGLNATSEGPIQNRGAGTKPMVYKDDLIEWWNKLLVRHEDAANQRSGKRLAAENQHDYGRTGTSAPEIGGGVKKRRRDKGA